MLKKLILIAIILAIVGAFFAFDLGQYLTLEQIQQHRGSINQLYSENQGLVLLGFFIIYVAVAALSLPGAALMTIAAGAFFGVLVGTVIVSFASSLGATLAFLISRFLLKDSIEKKFESKIEPINNGLAKEGAFYLFSLRLVPIFPFFVVNLVMGVTKLPVFTFYWVSQIGMFAGTIVFVNAGTQISQLQSVNDILSPNLLISFALLGIFPIAAKKLIELIKKYKK
jgi:uncharacterized membrane protein YdjX (TVP38/TMEM64 family)